MRKVLLFVLVLFAILTFASEGLAQNVIPIKEGEKAPFDGVLLDKPTAAKFLAEKEYTEEKCSLLTENEVGKATSECELRRKIAEARLQNDAIKYTQILTIKNTEIDRLNEVVEKSSVNWGPAWFASGAAIGIVTSITIFFISVQIVNTTDLIQK